MPRSGWDARAASVLTVARAMHARGLVVGSAGNVSCRVDSGMLITPTRTAYPGMMPADLVHVTVDGEAPALASLETSLHAAVYAARDDVGAVVHTHSVHATAWSFLGRLLEPETEDSGYHEIGPVRTTDPAPAGSQALAARAVTTLGTSRVVLLGRHGVLATGPGPGEALVAAEVVEHQARIAWLLRGAARAEDAR